MTTPESTENPAESEPRRDLPAVEPPSASFFVQLFLLPALIVFGIVAVWYLFGRIASPERSPEEYLVVLKSGRPDRWKAALDLSHLLQENAAFSRDPDLCIQLAKELQKALSQSEEGDRQYVEYLAGAVGSFQMPTGAPVLREAARPNQQKSVRRAALIALANLAVRTKDLEDPNVRPEVEAYLGDGDVEIRECAALVLGKLGDERAIGALESSLSDPAPSVRYNAATALAELGSAAAMSVYVEMLDHGRLSKNFVVERDESKAVDEPIVAAVQRNALFSLGALVGKTSRSAFDPVRPALETLAGGDNPYLKTEAKELLLRLQADPASERSPP